MKVILNNKGSTLLIVIIMTAVLTILGTALLSMSALNLKMKYDNERVKKSTYYSESGIDQVYAFVGTRVEESLEAALLETDSFKRALTSYLNETAIPIETIVDEIIEISYREDIGTVVNNTVISDPVNPDKTFTLINGIKDGADYIQFFIKDDINGIDYKDKVIDINNLSKVLDKQYAEFFSKDFDYKSFDLIEKIENLKGITNTNQCIIAVKDKNLITFGNTNDTFIIKDINSRFTYNDDIVKSITTNLVIKKPERIYPLVTKVDKVIVEDNPIWQNILISCKDITINETRLEGIEIMGDVYAFGTLNNGLSIGKNSKVNITGDVVSRYNIQTTGENAILNIQHGLIYCDSLITNYTAKNSEIITTNSNVHTKDDIELNGEGSKINILKGSYYGISDGDSSIAHDDSSAIIINAKLKDGNNPNGASMKIDGIKPNLIPSFSVNKEKQNFLEPGVWIPGTAYVNVDGEDLIVDGEKIIWPYQTAESVSIIGNYLTYTLPLQEPSDAYKELFNFSNLIVNLSSNKIPFILGYDPNLTTPQGSLDFKYFNIVDKKEYFMEVYRENPDLLDFGSNNSLEINNYKHSLGINIENDGSVSKDKLDILNMYRIKDMAKYFHIYYLLNGDNYENPIDRTKELRYPDDFNNEPYNLAYPDNFNLISKMVHTHNISSLRDISNTSVKNYIVDNNPMEPQKKATEIIYVSNPEANNIRIVGEGASPSSNPNYLNLVSAYGSDAGYFQGIIITQGNVLIDGKVNFVGTIIAGGDIEIINGEGSKFHNNATEAVTYIATLVRNNPELRNLLSKGAKPEMLEFNKQEIVNEENNNIQTNYKNLLSFNQWRLNQ